MASEQFANLAQTTLAAAITDTSGTSVSVTSGGVPFPLAAQFRVIVDAEIMVVTGGANTNTWTVTRGAEGSTAATHLIGAPVTHILTAGALATFPTLQPGTTGRNLVQPSSPAAVPLVVKGAGSQSADRQQWQASDGTVDVSIGSGPAIGIGAGGTPINPLEIIHTGDVKAISVVSHNGVFSGALDFDKAGLDGGPIDLIDLSHKSTGDAIYVVHKGGSPAGMAGASGGDSAFNVMIPYYIDVPDFSGTGVDGTVVNARSGMKGLFVQNKAINAGNSIFLRHFSNSRAVAIETQNPAIGNPAVGTGGGMSIDDWSADHAVILAKHTVAGAGSATLYLNDVSGGAVYSAVRSCISGTPKFELYTDGAAAFGGVANSAIRLQSVMNAAGVTRNLLLSNTHNAAADGVQIEGVLNGVQFGLIQLISDQLTTPAGGQMNFQVRTADAAMSTRIKLNQTGIGFFGVTPAARPTAYTQTYATATRTHNNVTSAAVSTTASTQTTPWGFGSQAQADAIPVAINANQADIANVKQVLNSVIDDLQANGLLQ